MEDKIIKMKKKYLIRCGMLPQDTYSDSEFLNRDRFGSNIGNLVYQYSVIRTLMTEDTEIVSDEFAINPNSSDLINKNYDAYIIPLANAFRTSFIPQLKRYTELIKKLEIPVVVVGIGLQAPYGYDVKKGFNFDKEVKEFVKAVLEKSSIIGLRGQITADYLEYLGFIPEKDFTVIGCPSMYTFGRDLKLRKPKIDKEANISINAANIVSEDAMLLLTNIATKYKNYYFIPQSYNEFTLNYFGMGEIPNVVPNFPANIASKFYKEGRVRFFLNAPTWFNYMKDITISVGTRLHGNIVATINGTPSITLIMDSRTQELADYHGLPSLTMDQVSNNFDLTNLAQMVDFSLVESLQGRRFDHFIEFLDKNDLAHIYKKNKNRKDAPLDELIINKTFDPSVKTITDISDKEKLQRFTRGYEIFIKRTQRLANNEKSKKLKSENNFLRNKLNNINKISTI